MSGALIAGGMGVASSVAGAAGGGKGDEGAAAGTASTVYDPFAEARQGYIKQLGKFMSSPDYIYKTDAYKARFAGGQQAVASSAASRGLLDSGAMGVELAQYGQKTAADEYQAEFARLAQLAGVNPLVVGGGTAQQGGGPTGWGDVAGSVARLPWGQIMGGGNQSTYGQNVIGGSAFLQ